LLINVINLSHLFQSPSPQDWLYLLLLFCAILFLILLSEYIRKIWHWPQEVTRKMVHISAGLLLLLTPLLIHSSLPLLTVAVFFTVFNFFAIEKNLLPGIHIDRQNYGTVYYPFSFFVLILLFWEGNKVIIIISMLIMALGDAMAAIVGRIWPQPHHFRLIHDRKSLEGSLAMFVTSVMIIFFTLKFYGNHTVISHYSDLNLMILSFSTAAVPTAAETLGHRGNDNLTAPLLSSVVLYFLLNHSGEVQFYIGSVLGALSAYLSYRLKFLTLSGAVTTFILATLIFGFGGVQWTVPILTFFVLSSFLSKISLSPEETLFEKGSQRDHLQVLANGGIAGLLMIIYMFTGFGPIYILYSGTLAAAAADTWATEIGMMMGQKPRLISNMQPVPAGTSGGVTFAGLLGAVLGAFSLAISSAIFYFSDSWIISVKIILIITATGFLGSLIDSLLGASLQVKYRCVACQKITEKKFHCLAQPSVVIAGVRGLDNDCVNFINTVSAVCISSLFLGLF
jgi:uncharacterized protein (TIGR00297 family)